MVRSGVNSITPDQTIAGIQFLMCSTKKRPPHFPTVQQLKSACKTRNTFCCRCRFIVVQITEASPPQARASDPEIIPVFLIPDFVYCPAASTVVRGVRKVKVTVV